MTNRVFSFLKHPQYGYYSICPTPAHPQVIVMLKQLLIQILRYIRLQLLQRKSSEGLLCHIDDTTDPDLFQSSRGDSISLLDFRACEHSALSCSKFMHPANVCPCGHGIHCQVGAATKALHPKWMKRLCFPCLYGLILSFPAEKSNTTARISILPLQLQLFAAVFSSVSHFAQPFFYRWISYGLWHHLFSDFEQAFGASCLFP